MEASQNRFYADKVSFWLSQSQSDPNKTKLIQQPFSFEEFLKVVLKPKVFDFGFMIALITAEFLFDIKILLYYIYYYLITIT